VKAHESNRAEVRRRVDSAAEFLGIAGLLSRRPDELSGGERQRVVLARAIARRPALLLLDEPLTGLDAPLREDVRRTLSSIHREHALTIVMVTHDQADALALGERVAVLDRGELQQCDTPEILYNRPATEFVARFIGDPPMSIFDATIESQKLTLRSTEGPAILPLPAEIASRFKEGLIHVGFRPEAMRIGAQGDLTATVDRVEHAGRDQVVWLRSGTQTLALRVPTDRKRNVGDRVPVGFDVSAIHGFDSRGKHVHAALD
jgi:multiple sugar transport system ATP-binding protein